MNASRNLQNKEIYTKVTCLWHSIFLITFSNIEELKFILIKKFVCVCVCVTVRRRQKICRTQRPENLEEDSPRQFLKHRGSDFTVFDNQPRYKFNATKKKLIGVFHNSIPKRRRKELKDISFRPFFEPRIGENVQNMNKLKTYS